MSYTVSVYQPTQTVKLKDGTKVKRTAKWYRIEVRHHGKVVKREKGPRDRKAAKHKGDQLVRGLERGEVGLVDPYAVHRATALADHRKDWLDHLRTAGRSPMYVYNCERRLTRLFDACGWKLLGDVDPNGFMRWRGQLRTARTKGMRKDAKGASPATSNQYLDTLNAFLNWCVRPARRMALNPMLDVEKVSGSKVRLRRALTDDEVGRLLAVAPPDRAIVYRTGLAIGLRRPELRALKWGDLRLAAVKPFAQLRAEATKARRGDQVFLPATLAADLRQARPEDSGDDEPVFTRVPRLRWWKIDLAAAGIVYLDKMGRQADFHAGTRKTLCTRMQRNNVPLASAMRVMRHTDSRLTLVDYTDDHQVTGDVLPEVHLPPRPPAASPGASDVAG